MINYLKLASTIKLNNALLGNVTFIALISFIGWISLSIMYSPNPVNSLYTLLYLILFILLGFCIIPSIKNNAIWFVRFISILTIIISIIAVGQYLMIIPYSYRGIFGSRASGLFSNPNHMAAFLAPCLIILFVEYIKNSKHKIKITYFLILVWGYSALIISGTRGAWFGFIVGLTFIFIMLFLWHFLIMRRNFFWILLLFLSFSGITYLIFKPTAYRPPNEQKPQKRIESAQEVLHMKSAKDFSIKERAFIWSISKEIIKDNIFWGVGFASFDSSFKLYKEKLQKDLSFSKIFPSNIFRNNHDYAHNEYIHILAETGIPGLFLFLLSCSILIFNLFRFQSFKKNITSIALCSSMLTILSHSLVSYPLHLVASSILFWSSFGLLLYHTKRS